MKTSEEIKKGLECCSRSDSCPQECPYYDVQSCGSVSKLDALAYIQQLEDHIRDLTKMIPKWISVEERLPKYEERVLITEGSCVFEAYRSISNKWVRNGIGWAEDVTHWMPLPEVTKEG